MTLPRYQVKLFTSSGVNIDAELEEASPEDMPSMGLAECTFNWPKFWKDTNPECEAIIKLHFQGKIFGLIHFGAYPYPKNSENRSEYIYIDHLERVNKEQNYSPICQWLIWYAVRIALQYCTGNDRDSIVELDSLEETIPYYQDKVMMEGLGWTTLAPGEEGYAFRFTREGAEEFCQRVEQEYGLPSPLD